MYRVHCASTGAFHLALVVAIVSLASTLSLWNGISSTSSALIIPLSNPPIRAPKPVPVVFSVWNASGALEDSSVGYQNYRFRRLRTKSERSRALGFKNIDGFRGLADASYHSDLVSLRLRARGRANSSRYHGTSYRNRSSRFVPIHIGRNLVVLLRRRYGEWD